LLRAIIFAAKSDTTIMGNLQSAIKVLNRRTKIISLMIVAVLLFQFSCNDGPKHPDVSNIAIQLKSLRLDQDLAAIDTNNVAAGLQQLQTKYPDFLNFYLDTLMGFGINGHYDSSERGIKLGLQPFLAHKDIRGLFDTVQQHFPDTKSIDEALTDGFRYMKHYYPSFTAPEVIYLITGLNQWSVFTVDSSILGVGLDMYLGPQYPFYSAVQIPDYVIRHCKPEYIPVNAFQAIYRNRHPFEMEERTLLDMMIQRGKEQYFLTKVLPETADTLRFGYSKKQLDWCEKNEAEVYNFFITKNLLYDTHLQQIARYITEGPTSTGMPPESPGNIGTWLGYRIVKAYMEQHPDMKMETLFAQESAQAILQESKYKPK
jgi:hypothetical protein